VLFCIEESRSLQSDLANLRITTDLDITLAELTELERRRNANTSSNDTPTTQQSPTRSPQTSVSNNIKPPQSTNVARRKVTLANKLSVEGKSKENHSIKQVFVSDCTDH
jgi:hypothetical protein